MIVKALAFIAILASYGMLFLHQERLFQEKVLELSFPPSSKIQQTALGYLRQLGGEMQFIKANVFLGGLKPGRDPYDYAESLKQVLDGAVDLHPVFRDTYFLTNASLPFIGPDYARQGNAILIKGMKAMPDSIFWPFFIGFNNFFHLNDFTGAAKYLKIASEKPEAPQWLAHLASTLAAKGGDLETGIFWLRGMVASTEDETERERYQKSLATFEEAATIQRAVNAFTTKYGDPPTDLDALVPEFVTALPQFEGYELSYSSPTVQLLRPHIEEQLRKRQSAQK